MPRGNVLYTVYREPKIKKDSIYLKLLGATALFIFSGTFIYRYKCDVISSSLLFICCPVIGFIFPNISIPLGLIGSLINTN